MLEHPPSKSRFSTLHGGMLTAALFDYPSMRRAKLRSNKSLIAALPSSVR